MPTRLSKKTYKNEQDAFNVLQLVLTNNTTILTPRFIARSRAISKTIAALTADRDQIKPAYADAVERALEQLKDNTVDRFSWSLESQEDGFHSMLLFV